MASFTKVHCKLHVHTLLYTSSFILLLSFFSEEDITAVKASLHYLKVVQKSTSDVKVFLKLFQLAVQLVLSTATRVLCNEKNSDEINKEVTAKVTNSLKALTISGTIKITNRSVFNVQHKTQGPFEAKVCM